jgi:hypothetical protein
MLNVIFQPVDKKIEHLNILNPDSRIVIMRKIFYNFAEFIMFPLVPVFFGVIELGKIFFFFGKMGNCINQQVIQNFFLRVRFGRIINCRI